MATWKQKYSFSKSHLTRSPPRTPQYHDIAEEEDGENRGDENGRGRKPGGCGPARKSGLATVYNSHLPRVYGNYGRVPTFNEDCLYDDDPKEKLDEREIQVALYQRKCAKLNVCPVGAYVRNPTSPVLNIGNYCLGPTGALALSVPLTLDMTVTTLNLQGNAIGAEGLRYLAPCIQDSCSITHLNLNDNDLGSEGAAIMEKILMVNISLEAVSLAGNNFTDSDAVHFSQVALSPEKKPLKDLDLSRNRLEDGAAMQFGEVLALNEQLEVLDLSWNQIRPKGGVALINGLKDNPRLKRLAVSRNGVGDEGCEAAATALVTNRSLLELDLSGNRVTNKGMLALAKTIKNNDTLTVLKLGDNLATGLGAQAVGEAILRSEECAVTVLDLTNINVFDILIKEVRDHAQSRPLTLKHGTISRYVLPMDELEKKFAEDFRTAHPELDTQANKDNEEEEDEKETKKSSKKDGSKKINAKKTKRK
ncbi:leucine-rich repeat-containing protein 74B-like isoform X1 [Littorina saxatilis]|uniref:Uncharacterized protein n=1 Tax=Littorina saxatilis TaxID=31220 RepID=A0AAN9BGZ5_9CAEN